MLFCSESIHVYLTSTSPIIFLVCKYNFVSIGDSNENEDSSERKDTSSASESMGQDSPEF